MNAPCERCGDYPQLDADVVCQQCAKELRLRKWDTDNDHPSPVKERGPGPP